CIFLLQTKYGESYDCVDFYQQPAFDHPLLRDHKYEYKVAVLRTSEKKKYYGGAMTTTVYHPVVQNMQYSSSRIVVRNGDDSIVVGWTVNPNLYPDNETRLFIYTNTKDSHCYNTYCPGFVITTSELPLDLLLKPYTVIGADYVSEKGFYIAKKDVKTGDWVFVLRRNNITMGYWPQKIFTSLADSADYIEWGGEVYSPQGTTPPPMGFGHLPNRGLFYDCYGRSISLINENYEIDYNPSSCTLYHTSERYNIIDVGYLPNTGRIVFYGGP
ncbi:hypothetical protein LINPERPRIM_LOCUS6747, partial [Linum perenne]